MESRTGQTGNILGTENIGKLILKFSVPAVISMVVNAIYNIVDQIFIGNGIGMLGVAATNVAFPFVTISTAVALLLGVGGASNFNLRLGSGQKDKASFFAGNSIGLMVLVGTLIAVLSIIFLKPLLYVFGSTDTVMPYALPYTLIIAIGIPFMVFSTGVCQLIRADGSPSYAMGCMLAGAIFNLIFDPIFLFVFKMGISGIALATTLGQVLSSIIGVHYLLKRFKSVPLKKEHMLPKWDYSKKICALGAAACFNQLAMTVVQIAMNNVLKHYGALSIYGQEIPLACVGAISKVNIIFISFAIGIAQGCQPIVGYNYGSGNYERVKETYKKAVTAASIIAVIAFAIFQIFPKQIISIFGSGSDLYFDFATRYLRIFMFATFINGIQPVTSNFFTSIGKSQMGIFISLTRQIIFLLPLIVILPMFFGITGVMYAGPIADSISAILAIIFVRREFIKMNKHIIDRRPADQLT